MHTAEHAVAIEMQRCMDDCHDCSAACVRAMEHWFKRRGKHVEVSRIRTLSDCIAICQTSAGFVQRGSPFQARICGLCAEVCLDCERDCRRELGDEVMQRCAEACRRCAESCERMASVAA